MATKCKVIEVKLTPITPFFFGKENMSELGNKFDYFQTSAEYPQQTTLLGFLRHKILRDNGINLDANNFRNDKSLIIDDLIGKTGFNVNADKPKDYGKIISISPCFIIDKDGTYLWDRSNEHIKNKKENEEIQQNEELGLSDSSDSFVWKDSFRGRNNNFLYKHQFSKKLNELHRETIFSTHTSVGIYKGGVKSKSMDDSYFINEYRLMQSNSIVYENNVQKFQKTIKLSFGFLAYLSEDADINTSVDFMPMGKERSMFKVECRIVENNIELHESYNDLDYSQYLPLDDIDGDIVKCILLSDAKLAEKELNYLDNLCLMQIVNHQRFRYIKRAAEKFFPGSKPIKENKAFYLLAKGSVLFFKNDLVRDQETNSEISKKAAIENIFNKSLDFKQIGYNYIFFTSAKTF